MRLEPTKEGVYGEYRSLGVRFALKINSVVPWNYRPYSNKTSS